MRPCTLRKPRGMLFNQTTHIDMAIWSNRLGLLPRPGSKAMKLAAKAKTSRRTAVQVQAVKSLAFYAKGPAYIEDEHDRRHFRKCKHHGSCIRCRTILMLGKWKDKLQLLPSQDPRWKDLQGSARPLAKTLWLDKKINADDTVSFGCVACSSFYKSGTDGNAWSQYLVTVTDLEKVKPSRFLPHAQTHGHKVALASYLSLAAGRQATVTVCVVRGSHDSSKI